MPSAAQKRPVVVIMAAVFLFHAGCMSGHTRAKMEISKAKGLYLQAESRAFKQWENLDRQRSLYQAACDRYIEAYYQSSHAFNWDKINDAVDACVSAKDFESGRTFMRFQEIYGEMQGHVYETRRVPSWMRRPKTISQNAEKKPVRRNPGTKPSILSAL